MRADLDSLSRECVIYSDHWIDELGDFRHVRITLTPDEAQEFARRSWAYELFLRAGPVQYAQYVPGIDSDIAIEADAYEARMPDGSVLKPYLCFAAFLGPHLEALSCTNTERSVVIDLKGREGLLFNVRRTIKTLTPTIRSFNNREKGLSAWAVTCEDDVRDLLYVMLRPILFDLVKEEPTPSRTGTHKFIDLCSTAAELLIEVKWISKRGAWKRIVDEIHVDVQTYATHPACRDVIFVIVDSARDIPDPELVMAQLTGPQKIGGTEFHVRVVIGEP